MEQERNAKTVGDEVVLMNMGVDIGIRRRPCRSAAPETDDLSRYSREIAGSYPAKNARFSLLLATFTVKTTLPHDAA